ncbi:cache domain-containing sensor histidine kinase [Clostridium sp. C105KSO13]|uniref:cache domain-containing sensor histidine kinase n=1 Tax=Clostridium sp. C105KSO13 TaxID=1776045 RepID=UPI0007407CE5|nr:sensor histidine kinase [Clostridium sp. C105KSO13]CUX30175.1 Sensor histidine kinase YehU [Clostridium sp. C105KSO13]
MGIKNKTLLLVSLVISFFIFVFIIIFMTIFSSRLIKENASYSKNLLENVNHNLTSYFDEISAIANEPNYDYDLQNYLKTEKENGGSYSSISSSNIMRSYKMSNKMFGEELNRRTDITSIIILGERTVYLYQSVYPFWVAVRDYSEEDWYQNAIENDEGSVVTGPQKHDFLPDNKEEQISVSRKIISCEDGSVLGVILIDLNLNKIEEICSAFYPQKEGGFCLLSKDKTVVYEQKARGNKFYNLKDKNTLDSLNNLIVNQKQKSVHWKCGGKDYQVVTSEIEKTGWTGVSITPMSTINHSMYENVAVIIVVGVSLLFLIVIVLNICLKSIVEPIVILADTMDKADGGNLDIRVPVVESSNEIGRLSRSYNKMLDRVKLLMKQVVSEQEEKRKYELQMLQAQINPHFLYNTLDSIIWMAEMKDESVVPMTEALAKLFRISLNKGNEFISIRDELEHVRNYLLIQSMRYEDKFDYRIVADDEVLNYETIKLIVQPLVENCIYHGIKMKKGSGLINIVAEQVEDDVEIRVSDNGIGMSVQLCQEVLIKDSRFVNAAGSGIGVKNVNERIRLYFGGNYGLAYESKLGEGTTVIIRIPKIPRKV